MSAELVTILEGNTFVVSDRRGDIEASMTDPTGLFSFDTRYLSRWVLTVNGQRLYPLSVDDLDYFETRFFLVQTTGTMYVDTKLSVIRRRAVGDGFREELTLLSHDGAPVDVTVRIDAAADFADLFEVKDAIEKRGTYRQRVQGGELILEYTRSTFRRSTVISATAPAAVDERGMTFEVRLEPHGSWTTELAVSAAESESARRSVSSRRAERARAEPRALGGRRASRRMRLGAAETHLRAEPRRPRGAALLARRSCRGKSLPAAGLPWFMTIFGRDSIFTSLQALPFVPELARTTLESLVLWQGTVSTTSATRSPARSCTRCVTAR